MIYVYRCPHCGVVAEGHRKLAERDEARETANGHRDPYAVAYARLDAAAAEAERLHAEMEARVVAAVRLGLQRATARCEAAEAEVERLRETMTRHDKDGDFWHGEWATTRERQRAAEARSERLEEDLLLADRWILNYQHPLYPATDGACINCFPGNPFSQTFRCAWHAAKARAALAAETKEDK